MYSFRFNHFINFYLIKSGIFTTPPSIFSTGGGDCNDSRPASSDSGELYREFQVKYDYIPVVEPSAYQETIISDRKLCAELYLRSELGF